MQGLGSMNTGLTILHLVPPREEQQVPQAPACFGGWGEPGVTGF